MFFPQRRFPADRALFQTMQRVHRLNVGMGAGDSPPGLFLVLGHRNRLADWQSVLLTRLVLSPALLTCRVTRTKRPQETTPSHQAVFATI